jgi:hypothetical protein
MWHWAASVFNLNEYEKPKLGKTYLIYKRFQNEAPEHQAKQLSREKHREERAPEPPQPRAKSKHQRPRAYTRGQEQHRKRQQSQRSSWRHEDGGLDARRAQMMVVRNKRQTSTRFAFASLWQTMMRRRCIKLRFHETRYAFATLRHKGCALKGLSKFQESNFK